MVIWINIHTLAEVAKSTALYRTSQYQGSPGLELTRDDRFSSTKTAFSEIPLITDVDIVRRILADGVLTPLGNIRDEAYLSTDACIAFVVEANTSSAPTSMKIGTVFAGSLTIRTEIVDLSTQYLEYMIAHVSR
jgi:hypothetical protein